MTAYIRSAARRTSASWRRLASAHEIGKLARHDEHGGEDILTREERVAISYNVDAFVAKHVRAVEIVGPESVESAAKAILHSLYPFRNELADARAAGRPVPYRFEPDSPYMALLNEYREDREAFVEAAKNGLPLASRSGLTRHDAVGHSRAKRPETGSAESSRQLPIG